MCCVNANKLGFRQVLFFNGFIKLWFEQRKNLIVIRYSLNTNFDEIINQGAKCFCTFKLLFD